LRLPAARPDRTTSSHPTRGVEANARIVVAVRLVGVGPPIALAARRWLTPLA
jgi:hypothetical protein